MKRYFIRCMGAILSALSVGTGAKSGTVDSQAYGITVLPNDTNRWYVGWVSNNAGESHSNSFKNGDNIFNQPLLTADDIDASYYGYSVDANNNYVYVTQPVVKHSGDYTYSGVTTSSGLVIISEGVYYLVNPGDGMYTGSRMGCSSPGAASTGCRQYILKRSIAVGGVTSLYYVATPYYFQAAGCCMIASGASGFSYSGNNETYSECECFYTYGDVSYAGSSTTCAGAKKATSGPTGTTGLIEDFDSTCPPRVQDVTVCYNHLSCVNNKYTNQVVGTGELGCDMILNPLVGMVDATHENSSSIDNWDLGRVECSSTGDGTTCNMKWYCTPSFIDDGMRYMTQSIYGAPNWCSACPVPNTTTVDGYTLTNTSYGSNGGYGIGQCYVKGPTATDNSGTFEFTSSAGAAQTCYGDAYAS